MKSLILVIEDDKDLANYMKDILIEQGFDVFSENSGLQGLKTAKQIFPDIVLLDLNLPDIDGDSICRELKKEFSEIKVIMITAKDRPEDLAHGLNLGADDYIPKPVSEQELIARVKARLRSNGNDKEELKLADLILNTKSHEVKRANKRINLSAQEYKLLHYFLMNQNRVLTREMVLSRIWRGAHDIETRVVDVYVGYLRKKIDEGHKKKLLHSVRGFGYMIKQ